MWHIGELKQRAQTYLHTAYWRSVVAALVLGLVTSGIAWCVIELGVAIMTAMPQVDFPYIYHDMSLSGMPVSPRLLAAAFTVVFFFGLVLAIIGICIELFLMMPIEVGCRRFYIVNHAMPGLSRTSELFHAFGHHYLNVVWTMLLKTVYTILWGILLVIPGWLLLTFVFPDTLPYLCLIPLAFPGLIKHYAYRLIPYILAEEPGMDFDDVIRLSRQMMKGNKWHAFLLDLSFLGWRILNLFTLGLLGVFYVGPYRQTANAELYLSIRDDFLQRQNNQ